MPVSPSHAAREKHPLTLHGGVVALSLFALACMPAEAADEVLETIEVTDTSQSLQKDSAEVTLTPGGVNLVDMNKARKGNMVKVRWRHGSISPP